jgi:hypothetical protein
VSDFAPKLKEENTIIENVMRPSFYLGGIYYPKLTFDMVALQERQSNSKAEEMKIEDESFLSD